jgi:hypothetical protein
MKTLTRPVAWAAAAAVVALVGHSLAQEKPKPADPPKKAPSVMQRKLAHAHKALEGLAVGNFDKIRDAADELNQCAQEASWKVVKTPRYELYSNDFQRNLEALKAAAKKKNVDAAALAYVDMTLTCVKCHQYVRDEGIGMAPPLFPTGVKALPAE